MLQSRVGSPASNDSCLPGAAAAEPAHAQPAVGNLRAPALRVGIIEDEALFSDLLAKICRQDFHFEIVFQESRGRAALELVRRLNPELVLLDISLPDIDGLEVARAIRREHSMVKILAISSLRDPVTLNAVHEIGLHGYVDKREQHLAILKSAIEQVSRGHSYFTPVVAEMLEALRRQPGGLPFVLSDYEQHILGLIGESQSDQEIAELFGISRATVQSRRRDIMQKLDIHSTPKLIRYAIEMGFTRPRYFPVSFATTAAAVSR